VHGICSTSCARESATRPADVAASAPCPGGPAEVRRWRVLRGKKHLHLERWSRGDRVLWDLSARSEHVSAKAFAKAASLLLTHHVKPLAQSKHDWMCGDR
jgi:hypothetical protein